MKVRIMFFACAAFLVSSAAAFADHHEGGPPPHPDDKPVAVFAPPDGTPGPDMPAEPPASEADAHDFMVDSFFDIWAGDDGLIDRNEFNSWIIDFHAPPNMMGPPPEGDMEPPPEGDAEGDEHMDPGPEGDTEGDAGMTGDLLIAGEGDLAGLPVPPACSAEQQESEMLPQAEGHPCEDRDGNLNVLTICNMEGFEMAAISLPEERAAACFGLWALGGEISFEIVAEDGTPVWDTAMGKEAYMGLRLDGPGVFHVQATGGSADGSVTINFTDVPKDM